jgi:hypothetical protein
MKKETIKIILSVLAIALMIAIHSIKEMSWFNELMSK